MMGQDEAGRLSAWSGVKRKAGGQWEAGRERGAGETIKMSLIAGIVHTFMGWALWLNISLDCDCFDSVSRDLCQALSGIEGDGGVPHFERFDSPCLVKPTRSDATVSAKEVAVRNGAEIPQARCAAR